MNKRRKSGFTLMEMLLVVSIMVMLMGMMGLGVSAALRAARRTKASAETAELIRAWKSYWKTYGDWPAGFTDNSGDPSTVEMTPANIGILAGNNPKNMNFIDLASVSAGGMLDPWGQPYSVVFNHKANTDESEYYQTSVFFPSAKRYIYEREY
jgi:prepilin-type N-terminal cleavage/methylation domain-containing protein